MQRLTIQGEVKTEHCRYRDYGHFHRLQQINIGSHGSKEERLNETAAWRHFCSGRGQ